MGSLLHTSCTSTRGGDIPLSSSLLRLRSAHLSSVHSDCSSMELWQSPSYFILSRILWENTRLN